MHNGSTISATNCYYGACNATEDADGVTAQTEGQFKDGTVAGLLGENFAQGKDGYPVFAVHAAGIELDQSSLTISVGNSKTLTATLTIPCVQTSDGWKISSSADNSEELSAQSKMVL